MPQFNYTFESARQEVLDRLGGRNTDKDQIRARQWLNSAILRLAHADIELPQMEREVHVQVVDGISQYDLTMLSGQNLTDILGIRQVRNETRHWKMARIPWKEWRMISTQALSAPVRWSRWGNSFSVDPMPEQTYDLLIDYRTKPLLDSLSSLGSQWEEAAISIATYLGWTALGEPQLGAAQLTGVPDEVRLRLAFPLQESDIEALWDDDFRMYPGTPFYTD